MSAALAAFTLPAIVRDLLALPPEASTVAPGIDALHVAVISATMIGSLGVAARAAWLVIRHRRRAPRELTPRVEASRRREGAIAGGILTLFIAFWVVGFRQYAEMQEPPEGATTVYVTAKQWMWKFAHPDGRRENDILTVPVGRPVRLVMTSRDVIHSFYVPAFRVKHDVLPGRFVTTWFEARQPGTYPILCAEFCGVSHSEMRGAVRVLDDAAYAAYLHDAVTRGESGRESLVDLGQRVATRNECFACHSVTGERHVGPSFARLFGRTEPLEGGGAAVVDEAYLTRSMMEPNAEVVAGYRPVMPSFAGRLEPADAAALVELIKSLRDAPLAPPVGLPAGAGTDGGAP